MSHLLAPKRIIAYHLRGVAAVCCLLFLLCLGIGQQSLAAAPPVWQPFGPGGGGWIEDVVSHPTNPQEVWAMTDLSGLFRSQDAGVTWRKMSSDVERGVVARKQIVSHNRQFAIDPTEPNRMYWGVCGMIWSSQDGGVSWQASYGNPPAPGNDKRTGVGHAMTVANDGTVFALDHESVLRTSRDHGATWSELTKPPVAQNSSDTPAFPFCLADGTLCVACRPSAGLAVSNDGGNSWSTKLATSIILNACAAPAGTGHDGTLYAFDSTGRLHRSEDSGKTFVVIKETRHQWKPGLRFAGGLAVSKSGKVMLWALGETVVSMDWGESWTRHRIETNWQRGSYAGMNRYASPEGKCSALAVTADGNVWLKCDSSLMCRSTDDGVSWTGSTEGLQVLCYFQGAAVSPHSPHQAMVAALDQGVFKTSDDGKSWQPMRIQPEWWDDKWQNHDGSVVKAHPTKPETWFAIIHGHGGTRHPRLHRTDDGGESWRLVLDVKKKFGGDWGRWLSDAEMGDLCFDPINPNIIYLSNYQLGVLRSEDGGATWVHTLKAKNGLNLVTSPSGQHVYLQCLKRNGLYASHDRGLTWGITYAADGVDGLAHHPTDESTLFVNDGQHENYWSYKGQRPSKLLKSTDAGKTWNELARLDGGPLYVDPVKPSVMLTSTLHGRGILRSTDGGMTWHEFHFDAPSHTTRGFTYGGLPGSVLYHMFGNMARTTQLYK
ncbi:Xyloglucanase precursor [Roseimaritima multifibrata]|uniref:Xyloglucanase n=1 Tax=Roseimaritima multifibrata TaxID=1930274 RepID=A0A517MAC9_9BACT|nr:sialidase family protein [Roseimaritima multifibrata]QDS91801.1 Xyloglucanase precursor [Roseimaritima multifibrata]